MSFKNTLLGLGGFALVSGVASADVLITEVVCGSLSGTVPRWVELTNTGDVSVDLSGYSLGTFKNGDPDLTGGTSVQLSGSVNPGESYVINFEAGDAPGSSAFLTVYGIEPSNYDFDTSFFNGDDVIALFLTDGDGPNGEATELAEDATFVDIFGEIEVGGFVPWEVSDSYAQRCNDTANGGVFAIFEWTIPGPGALLAGCGGNAACQTINHQTLTFPFSHPDCFTGTPFCFGDGSGTGCPCGNDGAAGEGCANGSGSGAALTIGGTESLAAGDLVLRASNTIPNQPGLFFQGDLAINGGSGAIFGDGLRCAGTNVIRLEVVVPDGNGDAQTTIDVGATGGAAASDVRYYQYWYRDPQGSACGAQFNLTNGYEINWIP